MIGPETLNISDYIDVLLRRKAIVITFFVVVVATVLVASLLMTPIYRATATIMIDVESPHVLTTTAGVEMGSMGTTSYLSYQGYFSTQLEIMTSRTLASQVVKEFDLRQKPEYTDTSDVVGKFLKNVTVEPVPDTRLVKLSIEDQDPALAAKLANRLAEIYTLRNLAYISKSERLNLLKNEYLRLETKLSEYSKVYKAKHPEMIKLRKEMEETLDYMNKEKAPVTTEDILTAGNKDQYQHALSNLKANNVSIIDPARVPTRPVRPKMILNLLVAVVLGFFGGAGLAFFFEYQGPTIKDIEDVERLTNWPFLGKIPETPGRKKEFHVQRETRGYITEAYRSICTRIFMADIPERPLKSIAVSSLGPQEGKTTSICNIAIVMAQNNKRVLLVDADMHKPRLQKVFRTKDGAGLAAYLSGEADYTKVIKRTEIDNVFLAADDRPHDTPSVLLAGSKMKEFVQTTENEFDYVLYDTPPIGAITDAQILSQTVDGVIFIMESGKTPKRAVLRNYKLLAASKIICAGVIIVKAPVRGREAYYYYHHPPK